MVRKGKMRMKVNDNGIIWLHIDSLFPHPDNPRKEIGDVTELAASIKAKGIMQNLTVVPFKSRTNPKFNGAGRYTVIIGHRRLAAAREAGLRTLPCVIVEMTEQEQIETMLLENMQRVDLTAYEQAQGFQMMLDFGDSIEEISEKTGFSETTIRWRIKMNELDAEKLREISARQISIADLDRLSKIEDIDKRNEVLSSIGTNNFDSEFRRALKKQEITKKMPKAQEIAKRLKARKIRYSETYGGKYQMLGNSIYLDEWDGTTIPVKEDEKRKIYYYLDEDYGKLGFYVERPNAAPVKRSKGEIEKEKRIKEAWDAYDEKTVLAYKLRSEFIASLSVTKGNLETVLRGAAVVCALKTVSYFDGNSAEVYKILGLEDKRHEKDVYATVCNTVRGGDLALLTKIIYSAFEDSSSLGYTYNYRWKYPEHINTNQLNALYAWLCDLGYEMSDEEKALQDGTHEVFSHKGS